MTYGMYYPVSATIVAEHPELAPEVELLDAFLRDVRGEPIRVERAADRLQLEPNLLARLLVLYERGSAVRRVRLRVCPDCDQPLDDGGECDLCERRFPESGGRMEEGFEPVDLGPVPASEEGVETPTADLEAIRDLLSPGARHATINIGEVHMGDKYSAGQAGAMGPGAQASHMTFQQIWTRMESRADLEALAGELERLRTAMRSEGDEPDHDLATAEVAKAQRAAKGKNGPGVLMHLKAAGKWALDVSTKIGTELATAVLKELLGIRS